jgi:hypothetical protein
MNESGTVAGMLNSGGVITGFTWKNSQFTLLKPAGGFTPTAIGDNGDLAGASGGVPAVWKSGTAAPTPLFRSDTTLGSIYIPAMNTRGEVLLTANSTTLVWRDGVTKTVAWPLGSCAAQGINNQGVILGSFCADLYRWWQLVDSPFGVTRVNGRKLAGESCPENSPGHGVVDFGIAVNDSNEALLVGHWQTPAGCRPFSQRLTAFNSRGLVASYVQGPTDRQAWLSFNGDSAKADELLETAAAAGWTVQSISRVTNDGHMWGTARRLADGKFVAVLLSPAK